jgi:hypothetical protein
MTAEPVTTDAVTIDTPGVYTITDTEYFADPVGGSLSASGARQLLPPHCPAVYHYERTHPRESTTVFDIGHAAHSLILGAGAGISPVDADDWRTKAAKDQRDEIRASGRVPLLTADYEHVQGMAAAVRDHPVAADLLDPDTGAPEQSLFWVDDETGIWRRARLDWLPHPTRDRMIIVDYKTAASADPDAFAKAAANYGYHQQDAWYRDAVTALDLDDNPAFVFVVQEKTPPYLVSVIELDSTALRIGRGRNRRAIDIYTECTTTGIWPGYGDDVTLVALPTWYERTNEEYL